MKHHQKLHSMQALYDDQHQNERVAEYIKRVREQRSQRDEIRAKRIQNTQRQLEEIEKQREKSELERIQKDRDERQRRAKQSLEKSRVLQSQRLQEGKQNDNYIKEILQLVKQRELSHQEKLHQEIATAELQRQLKLQELKANNPMINLTAVREEARFQRLRELNNHKSKQVSRSVNQSRQESTDASSTPLFKRHKQYSSNIPKPRVSIQQKVNTPLLKVKPRMKKIGRRLRFDLDGNPLFNTMESEPVIKDSRNLGNDYLKELRYLPKQRVRSHTESVQQSPVKKINYLSQLPKQGIDYRSVPSLIEYANSLETKSKFQIKPQLSDSYLIKSIQMRLKALELSM